MIGLLFCYTIYEPRANGKSADYILFLADAESGIGILAVDLPLLPLK
jgi:hypothetical protein